MSTITYGVCPNCNKITSKRTVGTSDTIDKKSYVVGPKCDTSCRGKTAKQAPDNIREK